MYVTVVLLPADAVLKDEHPRVANQPNTTQLSSSDHKMSMLTKPIYYYLPHLQ